MYKKLFSIILSVAMVFTMITPSFAAENVNTVDITPSFAAENVNTVDETEDDSQDIDTSGIEVLNDCSYENEDEIDVSLEVSVDVDQYSTAEDISEAIGEVLSDTPLESVQDDKEVIVEDEEAPKEEKPAARPDNIDIENQVKTLDNSLEAFAIYDATDESLTFYAYTSVPEKGSTADGHYVTDVYTGLEDTGAYTPEWNEHADTIQSISFDESFLDVQPVSCYAWFADMQISDYKNFDIKFLDTSKTQDMRFMFDNSCFESLALTYLDTSNVTTMRCMFQNCTNLKSVRIEINTKNVTDMAYMFSGCRNLETLSSPTYFDTSNVTDMSGMFYKCISLTSLNLSSFDTSNVTDMSWMFGSGGDDRMSFESLNISGFNTSNVTSMRDMFYGCEDLTVIDVSGFDTSKVTDMAYMFRACANVTTLDISGFDTSNVTDMMAMFADCCSVTSLNVNDFDTKNVTNMSFMFNECNSAEKIAVYDLNTSSVTTMAAMFQNCSNARYLNVDKFDTSKVTNMGYMFKGDTGLESLYLDSFDTTNVTQYSHFMQWPESDSSLILLKIDKDFDLFLRDDAEAQDITWIQYWYDSAEDGKIVSDNYLIGVKGPGTFYTSTTGENTVYDYYELVNNIRTASVNRREDIYQTFSYQPDEKPSSDEEVHDWMEQFYSQLQEDVYAHTGNPEEGDYLFQSLTHFNYDIDTNYKRLTNTMTYDIHWISVYKTTREQETAVTEKVKSIIDEMNWYSCTSTYDKLKDIYGYLCNWISYDFDHVGDTEYKLQHTAYAGLINGTCVCDGYAMSLYRILLEDDVGIDCRFIEGQGQANTDSAHAWNIVEMDHKYYNVDATWENTDAGKYLYFLQCNYTFSHGGDTHVRSKKFTTDEFNAAYPMSDTDYNWDTAASAVGSHNIEYFPYLAPTETKDGHQEYYHCTICDKYALDAKFHDLVYLDPWELIIPATGETHNGLTYYSAVASTDSSDGHIAYYYCPECGKYFAANIDENGDPVMGEEISEADTIEHNLIFVEAKEPTTTEEGSIAYYYCANCGMCFNEDGIAIEYEDTILSALGTEEREDTDDNNSDDGSTVTGTEDNTDNTDNNDNIDNADESDDIDAVTTDSDNVDNNDVDNDIEIESDDIEAQVVDYDDSDGEAEVIDLVADTTELTSNGDEEDIAEDVEIEYYTDGKEDDVDGKVDTEVTDNPESTTAIKTGGTNTILIYSLIACAAAFAIIVTVAYRRRKA